MGLETSAIIAIAAVAASAVGTTAAAISANKTNQRSIEAAEEAATTAYERQNEQYEQYMSPSAKAKEYASIGINPAAALTEIGSGSVGSVPQATIPNLQNPLQDFSQLADQASRAASQISDSRVKNTQVGHVLAQTYGEQVSNHYQELQNGLLEKYGDRDWSGKLNNLIADTALKYAQGDMAGSQKGLNDAMAFLTHNEGLIKKEEAANIAMMISKTLMSMDAQIDASKASAQFSREQAKSETSKRALNYSMGNYYNQLAQTEKAMRDGTLEMQQLQIDTATINKMLLGNEQILSDRTLEAKTFGLIESYYREGLISENVYKEGQILSTKRDWAGRQEFANYMRNVTGSMSDALNAYSNLRGVNLRRLSSKERNDIHNKFVDEYKQRGHFERENKINSRDEQAWPMYMPYD